MIEIGGKYREAIRTGQRPQATLEPQPAIFIYPGKLQRFKLKVRKFIDGLKSCCTKGGASDTDRPR